MGSDSLRGAGRDPSVNDGLAEGPSLEESGNVSREGSCSTGNFDGAADVPQW